MNCGLSMAANKSSFPEASVSEVDHFLAALPTPQSPAARYQGFLKSKE
jgi:hypothetical protein